MHLLEKSVDTELTKIKRSLYHWRSEPAQEDLDELAESLKTEGQIHNVSLVKLPQPARGVEYELVNGHRRFMAAKQANIVALRADIYELDPDEITDENKHAQSILKFLFAANLQEELQPLERAETYRQALNVFVLDPEELAGFFGRTPAEVSADLKYLFIDPTVAKTIRDNYEKISSEHVRLLAEYSAPTRRGWALSPEQQMMLTQRVITGEDKVIQTSPPAFKREVEKLRKEARQAGRKGARPMDEVKKAVAALERDTRKLVSLELPSEIDFVAKSQLISQLHTIAGELVRYARDTVSRVPEEVLQR